MTPAWAFAALTGLTALNWRRIAIMAGLGGAALIGAAALHKCHYVPRADYETAKRERDQARSALNEKDAALEEDARLAEQDALRIHELEMMLDAYEASRKDAGKDDPPAWSRDTVDWLRRLAR